MPRRETSRRTALERVGEVIRARREAAGLTQEDLAERCEMHPNYVGLIERGERNVTVLTLLVLASGLRSTPAELLRDVAAVDRESARAELRRLRNLRG